MTKLKIDLETQNKLLKQELEFNKKEISLLNEIINQINIHKDREIKRNDRLSNFFDELDEDFKEIQKSHDNIYSYLSSMDERHCNTHNDRDKKYVGKINELVQPINKTIMLLNEIKAISSPSGMKDGLKYLENLDKLLDKFELINEKYNKDDKLNLNKNEFDDLDLNFDELDDDIRLCDDLDNDDLDDDLDLDDDELNLDDLNRKLER